jgi:hypothetical protein
MSLFYTAIPKGFKDLGTIENLTTLLMKNNVKMGLILHCFGSLEFFGDQAEPVP